VLAWHYLMEAKVVDLDHRDIPITNFHPRKEVVFRQRVVQRGPTVDDPTHEVSYVVRRLPVLVFDFYKNRPEAQHG
jgi:hypothetical protein